VSQKKRKLKFCDRHANIYEEVLTEQPIAGIVYIVERVSEAKCQLCQGYSADFRRLIEGEDP